MIVDVKENKLLIDTDLGVSNLLVKLLDENLYTVSEDTKELCQSYHKIQQLALPLYHKKQSGNITPLEKRTLDAFEMDLWNCIVRYIKRLLPSSLHGYFDDCYQNIFVDCYKHFFRYDVHENTLSTFFYPYIKGGIYRTYDEYSNISSYYRKIIFKIYKAYPELDAEDICNLPVATLTESVGLPENTIKAALGIMLCSDTICLDIPLESIIKSDSLPPEEIYEQFTFQTTLCNILADSLDELERGIFMERLFGNEVKMASFSSIARKFSMTDYYVRKVFSEACDKVRNALLQETYNIL